MRVLLYVHSGHGTMKHYTEGLAGGLSSLGVDTAVLTKVDASFTEAGFRVLRRLHDYGRKVPRVVWPFERTMTGLYNGMVRAESSRNYTLCHLQSIYPLFDWATLWAIQTPLVLTVHDVHPHFRRWSENARLRRVVYSAVDAIIVHSRHNAEALAAEGRVDEAKISVIRHGLQPISQAVVTKAEARKQLDLPAGAPIALAFGTVRENKGLDVAIKALCRLPEWRLLVAGLARDATPYIELARRLGVESRVLWRIGFVPDALITPYFMASDAVLLPYRPSFESQSGVLFQAYRHRVPVVVTDVGGLGETVNKDKTGIVVSPEDPDALADGIEAIIRLGVDIDWERVIEEYAWDRVAKDTAELYHRVSR